jgi:lipopolysaccharide export system permease protein
MLSNLGLLGHCPATYWRCSDLQSWCLFQLSSLTGFISVLAAVTRSYRDSEMVVWFASGLPLTSWIRPVLQFGLLLVMVVGTLSLVVTPWARMTKVEFTHRFEKRGDLERLAPSPFRESAPTFDKLV